MKTDAPETRKRSIAEAATAREPIFVEAASWPIEAGALAALVDIGLTSRQIAQYFGVARSAVEALRERYGFP